jgi:NADPH:quinone reductase-like Zn-dependent oxidoreductase
MKTVTDQLTAYRALVMAGQVLGKRVIVTGASGGVGRFAIQLTRAAGGHSIGPRHSLSVGETLLWKTIPISLRRPKLGPKAYG